MLEAVFLGTGSGIPTPSRGHPAIWLRYEGSCMLFDCGEGTQRQLMKARLNFMRINRIFITHWHADHWLGLIGLLQSMNLEGREKPLHIYGPEAERFVRDILDLDYWGTKFRVVPENVPYEGKDVHSVVKAKDFEITSIPVKHSVPAVAYAFREHDTRNVDIKKAGKLYGLQQSPLVGKLKREGEITYKGKKIRLRDVSIVKQGIKFAYSGDTEKCANMAKLAGSADVLVHEATFGEDVEEGIHALARDAAETAKKAKAGRLILTHFSRRYLDTEELVEEARKVFEKTVAARDFMRLEIRKGKPDGVKVIYKNSQKYSNRNKA